MSNGSFFATVPAPQVRTRSRKRFAEENIRMANFSVIIFFTPPKMNGDFGT